MSEIFTTRKGKCFNKTWAKTMTEVALSFKDEDEEPGEDKVKMSDRKVEFKFNSQQWRIKQHNP